MRRSFPFAAAASLTLLSFLAAAHAAGPVLRDQSDLSLLSGDDVADLAVANDFVVESGVWLTSATVWLADETTGDNGVLDSFKGGLGWAIYSNGPGLPGSLLQAGRALALTLRDTGRQDTFGADLFAVHFDLEPPLSVPPGTYWFALRESTWGSAFDGSAVFWQAAATQRGAARATSPNETNPGAWLTGDGDNAFVLLAVPPAWDQSPIYADGGGTSLTELVVANDFTFAATVSFSTIDAWILDGAPNVNGLADNFSGAMGWAIYTNSAANPATKLFDGTASSVAAVDTGLGGGGVVFADVLRVRVPLGRTISLGAGTYWLALHEGGWLAGDDGTDVFWYDTPLNLGFGSRTDANLGAPGVFLGGLSFNSAFVLFDQPLFASGFEAGGTCAWSSSSGGACL